AARRRAGAGGRQRPAVRTVAQPRAGGAPHRRQLPGLRAQARMSAPVFPKLVLFDLDGTLLDSAPDMAATVNRMRAARGRGPMALAELRPHVSKGSRAMSAAAFPELGGEVPGELVREFLDTYE